MKNKLIIGLLLIITALLFSGCTGTGISSSWPGITVANDVIYTSYGSGVFAVNAQNGTVIWRYPEKATKASFYAAPALTADGQLVVGDYAHVLHVIDAKTGQGHEIFTAESKWIGESVVVDGTIYASNADGYLYALDLNGNVLWKYKTESLVWSNPLILDGVVYQGGMDHFIYAIDANNGNLIWKTDTGGAIIGNIVNSDGSIFLGTMAKEAIAVDKVDGKILWRYAAAEAVWSGPAIRDGNIYFGDLAGNFYALAEANQAVLWQYKANGAIVGTPLLADDGIYFTAEDGALVHLDYTGKLLYSKPLADKLYGTPVPVNGKLLIGTTSKDTILIMLDENGNQVWALPQPK
jgi:outer membrane protein assembly factor BamB